MSFEFRRTFGLFIPALRSRSVVFLAPLVDDRVVKVVNFGPGLIGVTRSVSADGIHYTILPGITKVGPGRFTFIHLPTSAVFVKLRITSLNFFARVLLSWEKRFIPFLINAH